LRDNIKMDVGEIQCARGIWKELALDSVQCRTLVLMVLKASRVAARSVTHLCSYPLG